VIRTTAFVFKKITYSFYSMGTLVLLENRYFGENGLIAVPEKLYDLHRISYGLDETFFGPLKLPNITEDDFNIHKLCKGRIPIKVAESLGEPDIEAAVKYLDFDSMKMHTGLDIDMEAIMKNEHTISMLVDHSRIKPIAYHVKFEGKYTGPLHGSRNVKWNAIFLAEAEDKIELVKLAKNDCSALVLNGKPSDLRTVSYEYGHPFCGTLGLYTVGELELHLGSLKPYRKSASPTVKSYESGPWIRLDTEGSYLSKQKI
jgi:hypothetical protein